MKRTYSKKKSAPRTSARKSIRSPTSAKRSGRAERAGRPIERPPSGYVASSGRLLVPERTVSPVPAGKLRSGLRGVRRQIDDTLDELIGTLTGHYEIKEIKLVASFNADGKFLGFGVGGAASIEITICPCDS